MIAAVRRPPAARLVLLKTWAEELGVPYRTLLHRSTCGDFAVTKIGRRVYVDRDEGERYLTASTQRGAA